EPFESSTVLLRIQPDGRCKLLQWINATAESKLDLRSSPFDNQKLQAVFEVFGFDADLVLLQASSAPQKERLSRGQRIASNNVLARTNKPQRLWRHCPPAVVPGTEITT
ncbi:MAG: hypothetical protein NXI32_08685, partial [bacterium]|nr:hypothetical protein [bacterium]